MNVKVLILPVYDGKEVLGGVRSGCVDKNIIVGFLCNV